MSPVVLHIPHASPALDFDNAWPAASERLRMMLNGGANIVVHCKGGLGRAGMVAARLLVELGDAPDVAIRRVRHAQGKEAVDRGRQEQWVANGLRTGVTVDWFERLTGFRESPYEETRAKLKANGFQLASMVNGKSYGVGSFELVSLKTLRERAAAAMLSGTLKASLLRGSAAARSGTTSTGFLGRCETPCRRSHRTIWTFGS